MTSSLYQELSNSELDIILKNELNINKYTANLLTGGMFNTTYKITTDDKSYVLRMGPVNRHLLLPFEENLMASEDYFYSMCYEKNIPVSNLVVTNTTKKFIDRDYMIVDFIPSNCLSEVKLDDNVKSKIYKQVGEIANKIHSITNKKFGRLSNILDNTAFDLWSDFLYSEVLQWSKCVRPYNIFSEKDIEDIKSLYLRDKNLFDEIKTPCLIHCDLWEGNILIDTTNEVIAVIDGDRALFGDVDFEFASGWMINDSFIKGYNHPLNMDPKNIKRRKLYSMLYNLNDCYILKAEYNEPEKSENMKKSILETLYELI